MCNIFTLGIVFTSIEIGFYVLAFLGCAIKNMLETKVIMFLLVAIVGLVLELIGLNKKHYGLTIFSIVFRTILVIYCLIGAIDLFSVLEKFQQSYYFKRLTHDEKIQARMGVVLFAVSLRFDFINHNYF